ncbi:M23 family metallopeptidase [Leucobacter soli]|uniref:M23 family metallopeptidase n=1 Tax=Leucobacter soli TaxID=2812850 RepID=UPI00360E8EE5
MHGCPHRRAHRPGGPGTAYGSRRLPESRPHPHAAPHRFAEIAAARSEPWFPPLGEPLRVSAAFSLPNGPYRAGHRGIDLPASTGDIARAPASGTVSFSGTVVDRPVLSIRLDERTVVSLEPVESPLRAGDPVARGDRIGAVAARAPGEARAPTGGHCTEHCLHLGVRVDGEYVNPLRFLRTRPILLPW